MTEKIEFVKVKDPDFGAVYVAKRHIISLRRIGNTLHFHLMEGSRYRQHCQDEEHAEWLRRMITV